MRVHRSSIFVSLDPRVEVATIEVYATADANNWQFLVEDQMLHGLFGPPQVHGGLFYIQQGRLDSANEMLHVGREFGFDVGGNLLSDHVDESGQHNVTGGTAVIRQS